MHGHIGKNWQATTGVLLVAAIPLFIGFWSGWRREPPEALRIESTQLDVGVVRTGRPFTHQIVVRNESSRTIVIPEVDVGYACTDVTPSNFRLQPGESITLEVTLDPELLRRSFRGKPDGNFQIHLVLFKQGEAIPQQWILSGTLKSAFTLTPPTLAFYGPDVSTVGVPGPTLQVAARLKQADHELAPVTTNDEFDVVCERDSTEPEIWHVKVTPHARSQVGSFETEIWLGAKDPRGVLVGEWPLRVKGQVDSRVSVLPATVDLFPAGDEPLSQHVIVRSNTGKPFRIAQNQSAGNSVEVKPDNTEWAREHLVELIFDSKNLPAGKDVGLAIEYEDGRSDEAVLKVTIHRFQESPR